MGNVIDVPDKIDLETYSRSENVGYVFLGIFIGIVVGSTLAGLAMGDDDDDDALGPVAIMSIGVGAAGGYVANYVYQKNHTKADWNTGN